ncbi:MAG: arylsulfatase [Bryobacteraceae bacterium]
MDRRTFLATATAAALPLAGAAKRPNIVYILADDLGWGDLGCYNAKSQIPTPNLDRLAGQGVRFTDMHSPSAVCTPTRYGILTGRYCWRSPMKKGVLNGYSPSLIEEGRPTVASFLKSAGYQTSGVGKWHLGLGKVARTDYQAVLRPGPVDKGFDSYFGIPASLDMPPYLYFQNDRAVEQPTATTPDTGGPDPSGAFWRGGPIAPSLRMVDVLPTLTRKSVECILAAGKKTEEPFFHYFAMTGPHTPWMPTPEFRGKSRAGEYGDFVAQVDDSVGQVLRAIEDAGQSANTMVVFASDNGARWKPEMIAKYNHRANADWRGMKADIWDGGHRIPFLARLPGRIPAGSTTAGIGCLTDFFGTVAGLLGRKLPHDAAEDSFNLLPLMTGKSAKSPHEAVVHHSSQGMFSIRDAHWKLVLGHGSGGFTPPVTVETKPGDPPGELYDMQKDPGETRDLYTERPDVVSRLAKLLARYQSDGRSRLD